MYVWPKPSGHLQYHWVDSTDTLQDRIGWVSGYRGKASCLPLQKAMLISFLTKRTLIVFGWQWTLLKYSPPPHSLVASGSRVSASAWEDITGTLQRGGSGKASVFIMKKTDSVFTCFLPFALPLGPARNTGAMPKLSSFSHKEESHTLRMVEERK